MISVNVLKKLNINRKEARLAGFLMMYSFLLGIALAFYFTMAITIFLNRDDFRLIDLSWVYIFSGLLSLLLSKLFTLFQKKIPHKHLIIAALLFLLLATGLLLKSSAVIPLSVAPFFLLIWVSAFMYIKTFCFWGLANNLLDLDQGKRLFGLIGIGEVLSNAFSFFSLPFLLSATGLGIKELGNVAVAAILLSTVMATYIVKKYVIHKQDTSFTNDTSNQKANKIDPQYKRSIILCLTSSILCFYFIDYIFLDVSRKEFNGLELAEFMAWFWGSVSLLELLSKTFLYIPLLKYYGIKFTLMLLPVALLLITFTLLMSNFFNNSGFILILILFIKLLERVLNSSISSPGMQIVYQTFPDSIRSMTQAKIEGVSNGYGNLMAGLLLLLITFFQLKPSYHYMLIMMINGCWIYFIMKLYHRYNKQLKNIISGNTSIDTGNKQKSGYDFVVNLAKKQGNVLAGKVLKYLDPADRTTIENDAITNGAEKADISQLEQQFDETQNIHEKLKIIRQFKNYAQSSVINSLCEKLGIENKQIKKAVINTFYHFNFKPQGQVRSKLKKEVMQTMAIIFWLEACNVDLHCENQRYEDLLNQLHTEKEEYQEMLLDLLGLLFGKSLFQKVKANLYSKERHKTLAFTLELINNFVNDDLKALLIPLFRDSNGKNRVRLLRTQFPQQKLSVQDRLIDILNCNYGMINLWTKSMALGYLINITTERAKAAVLACQYHHHPLFREMVIHITKKQRNLSAPDPIHLRKHCFRQNILTLKKTNLFNSVTYEELIFLVEKTRFVTINPQEKFYLAESNYHQKFYYLINGNTTLIRKNEAPRNFEIGKLWYFTNDNFRITGCHSYFEANSLSQLAIFNPACLLKTKISDVKSTKKLIDHIELVA